MASWRNETQELGKRRGKGGRDDVEKEDEEFPAPAPELKHERKIDSGIATNSSKTAVAFMEVVPEAEEILSLAVEIGKLGVLDDNVERG